MSDEISQIINQAKSQARLENIFKFLGKNSKILIYCAAAFLGVILLFFAFSIYQKSAQEKYSAMLHQSLIYQQSGQMSEAKKELEKIVNSSAPNGVKSLASLRYAAFLLEEQKINEAKEVYTKLNQCYFCDDYIKDLSGLLLVRIMVLDKNETASPEKLIEKISKIMNRSENLKNEVAEQLAFFQLFTNKFDQAYKTFEKISNDASATQAIKQRAEDGMKIVISKGFQPVK